MDLDGLNVILKGNPNLTNQSSRNWPIKTDEYALTTEEVTQRCKIM